MTSTITSKFTKAQLLDEVSTLRVQLAAAQAINAAQSTIAFAKRTQPRNAVQNFSARSFAVQEAHAQYTAALFAAREMAMKTGRCVVVGASHHTRGG